AMTLARLKATIEDKLRASHEGRVRASEECHASGELTHVCASAKRGFRYNAAICLSFIESRRYSSGHQRVDADALGRVLQGQDFGQANESCLRAGIGGVFGSA